MRACSDDKVNIDGALPPDSEPSEHPSEGDKNANANSQTWKKKEQQEERIVNQTRSENGHNNEKEDTGTASSGKESIVLNSDEGKAL